MSAFDKNVPLHQFSFEYQHFLCNLCCKSKYCNIKLMNVILIKEDILHFKEYEYGVNNEWDLIKYLHS